MNILYFTPSIGNGGVEKMLIEWISGLYSKGNYTFDIVTTKIIDNDKFLELKKISRNIYLIDPGQLKLHKKIPQFIKILLKGKYDIFHAHSCFAFDFWMFAVAKIVGVKLRIIHSHNSKVVFRLYATKLLHNISRPFLRYFSTDYMACGQEAGFYLLGDKESVRKKMTILENGINIKDYLPNKEIRDKLRKEFCVSDKKVLVTVGRLEKQKNIGFLLKVFAELLIHEPSAVLFVIGDGSQKNYLMRLSQNLHIDKYVKFLGNRTDVPFLLNAMDAFVLTSLYEGLGISAVEAQCAGLSCVLSDSIPNEVNLSGNANFISLNTSKEEWSSAIKVALYAGKDLFAYKKIMQAGYDIDASVTKLDRYYKKISNRQS